MDHAEVHPRTLWPAKARGNPTTRRELKKAPKSGPWSRGSPSIFPRDQAVILTLNLFTGPSPQKIGSDAKWRPFLRSILKAGDSPPTNSRLGLQQEFLPQQSLLHFSAAAVQRSADSLPTLGSMGGRMSIALCWEKRD